MKWKRSKKAQQEARTKDGHHNSHNSSTSNHGNSEEKSSKSAKGDIPTERPLPEAQKTNPTFPTHAPNINIPILDRPTNERLLERTLTNNERERDRNVSSDNKINVSERARDNDNIPFENSPVMERDRVIAAERERNISFDGSATLERDRAIAIERERNISFENNASLERDRVIAAERERNIAFENNASLERDRAMAIERERSMAFDSRNNNSRRGLVGIGMQDGVRGSGSSTVDMFRPYVV